MSPSDSYFILRENITLKRLFFILFGAVTAGLLVIFRYYFWPFLMALILYLALKPFHDVILKYVKKRSLSSMIVMLLLIILILVPMIYLLINLTDQAYQLYVTAEEKLSDNLLKKLQTTPIVAAISERLNIDQTVIVNKVSDYVQRIAGKIFTSITAMVAYPISLAIDFFFMILILFFLFKDGYKLSSIFFKVSPFPEDLEKRVVDRLKEVIKIILAGNLIIMILQGTMVGISLYIAGVGMPLLWGSIAAILSLIPIVGTTFVWAPAAIYLSLRGFYLSAAFVAVWSLFWYLALENLVKPKVFGEKLHFHPLVLFFLLLGSIHAMNVPGIILGPIILTLFYSLWEIYKILEGIDTSADSDVNS